MSRVTNVILTTHMNEEEAIESLNRFLETTEGGGGGKFIEVTEHAGGYKHMECNVHLSAFNHADTNVILKGVHQAPWDDREAVQVFVKEEEEPGFRPRWYGENLSERISLDLTREDLSIIRMALDKVCFGLDLQNNEFEFRFGSSLNTALTLMARLGGY